MSAYICSPDHIKALAIFAAGHSGWGGNRSQRVDPRYFKYDGGDERMHGRRDCEVATYYANILYCENIRSVQARYPQDTFDDLPGPCAKPELLEVSGQDFSAQTGHVALVLKPVDILKMCDGLEYQSCETDDWDKTLAYRLLTRIRKAAIHELPGYEDAPWEYTKPEIKNWRAA